MAARTTPHLRNACDACTAAKVKCSQGRPQCKRCEYRGFLCQYSVSLRSTKNARRPSSVFSSAPSVLNLTTPSSNYDSDEPLDDVSMASSSAKSTNRGFSHAYNHITSLFDDDSVIPSFVEGWDPEATNPSFQTGFPESNDATMPFFPNLTNLPQDRSSPRAPQPTKVSQQAFNSHSNNNSNNNNNNHNDNNNNNNNNKNNKRSHPNNLVVKTNSSFPLGRARTAFPTASPPPPTPASTPTASASNGISLLQTCHCQQLIPSKLSEISHRKIDHTIPVDQCLSENKSVIMLCHTTVNCSNTDHDEDLVLMLTLLALITHVILFYDRPLGSDCEMVDSSSEDSTAIWANGAMGHHAHQQGCKRQQSQRSSSKPQLHPRLHAQSERHNSHDQQQPQQHQQSNSLRVRLSLGTYELDTRDEQILQISLLRIELSKIKSLMEAFERRFCTLEWMSGGVLGEGTAGMGGEHGSSGSSRGGMSIHGNGEEKPLGEIIAWLKRRLRGNYEALAHRGAVRM